VSHLGDILSALVDGELSGAELDRASAHLAACDECQREASSLRQLKQELRALAGACDAEGIASRLLALTSEDGLDIQSPARYSERDGGDRPRPGAARRPAARPGTTGPYTARRPGQARRRRGRYVLWGTVSLVVVGIGTAAFGMGGGAGGGPGPRITPQVEVFDVEHAANSGDVPFADPSDVSARLPVAVARP
jgi:anti-sigma factor RsiW